MSDTPLADAVFDHLEANFPNNDGNGFDVYASSETGAAAVGYRPGIIGAQPIIRRQVMVPWANSLLAAGFDVSIDYSGEGRDRAPAWLHVTGRRSESDAGLGFDILARGTAAK